MASRQLQNQSLACTAQVAMIHLCFKEAESVHFIALALTP